MSIFDELDSTEVEQVSGGASFALQATAVRSLTASVSNKIGNVAICSGCHGCTHVGANIPITGEVRAI
jgi:cytochrome c553